MANEKTIGLRIVLNGFKGVVTNITQLEEEIRKAKEDLRQLEIGSPIFKELTTEIALAEAQLKGLNEAATAEGYKKGLNNWIQFGAGVSAAFGAATAALSLFSDESEESSRLAAQAQSALALALSASAIAQLEFGGATLASTIATKAFNASQLATNATLRAFYALIAANPVGVILVALGALVGVMSLFGKETKQTYKEVKQLGTALSEQNIAVIGQTARLKTLVQVVNDENSSNKTKLQAYKELQKILPELNGYTLQQAQNQGLLNAAVERELTLIGLKAQLKAYEEIYTQQLKDQYEQQEEINKGKRIAIALDAEQVRGRALMGGSTVQQAEEAARLYKERELAKLGEFNIEEKILDLNKQILGLEGDRANAAAVLTNQQNAQATALARFNKLLQQQVQLQGLINQELGVYAKQTFEYEAGIIEAGNKIVEAQNTLVEERRQYFRGSFGALEDELKKLFFDIVPDAEERKKLLDGFDRAFQVVDEQIQNTGEAFKGGFEGVLDVVFKNATDGLIELSEGVKVTREEFSNIIPKESQIELVNYFKNFRGFTEAIEKAQEGTTLQGEKLLFQISKRFSVEEELQSLQARARKNIEEEQKNGQLRLETEKDIKDQILKQFELQSQITDLTTLTEGTPAYETALKTNEEIQKFVDLIAEGVINQGYFLYGLQETKKEAERLGKVIDEGVTKQIEQLNNQSLPAFGAKLKEIAETDGAALGDVFGVLLKNIEKIRTAVGESGVNQLLKNIQEGLLNNENLTKEQLQGYLTTIQTFRASFEEQIAGTTTTFDDMVENIQKRLKDLAAKDALDTFKMVLSQFTSTINQLSALMRESFSFQLEVLETRYTDAMEGIVGETKQANEKRVELEKAYQKEKARIEKESRIKTLQFTLAQTIASTAQAIVAALEIPPPAGPILAGINGAIGAAQIGLIGQQIAFAQTLRRGGLLGSGGYISGASHEQGGVYAGGGYILEGNEAVINRQSAIKYGSLLSTINEAGGGRPIVVNNAMDSRLIEVLARQRTEPIRAYVIEQDITKAQAINRRLDSLATL